MRSEVIGYEFCNLSEKGEFLLGNELIFQDKPLLFPCADSLVTAGFALNFTN